MAVLVDQVLQHNSMGGRPENYTESQPPWEHKTAPVPYLKSGSKDLTEAERQALAELWATREQYDRQESSRDVYVRDFQHRQRPMSPDQQDYGRAKTPLTAPPWTSPRAAPSPPLPPAERDPPEIPSGPRSAPAMPSFVQAPYSPPLGSGKSFSSTGSRPTRSETTSRVSEPSITAFPGTMSAREKTQSRRKTPRSASADAAIPTSTKQDSPSFGKRFKSAFKDMFKREPVDDSNLERIEDRHWAEDEY